VLGDRRRVRGLQGADGKRVSQAVKPRAWDLLVVDADRSQELAVDDLDAVVLEWSTVNPDEDPIAARRPPPEEAQKLSLDRRMQRDNAALVAFGLAHDEAVARQVVDSQRECFGDPQPSGCEEADQRGIGVPMGLVLARSGDKRDDLLAGEDVGLGPLEWIRREDTVGRDVVARILRMKVPCEERDLAYQRLSALGRACPSCPREDRRDLDEAITSLVGEPAVTAQDAVGIAHAVTRRASQLEIRLDRGDHRASGHGWAMRLSAPTATFAYTAVDSREACRSRRPTSSRVAPWRINVVAAE